MPQPVSEPYRIQQFNGPFLPLAPRQISFKHWNLHIFLHGKSGEQVEGLENESDVAGPVFRRVQQA